MAESSGSHTTPNTPCGADRTDDPNLWEKMRAVYDLEAKAGNVEYPLEEPIMRQALLQFGAVANHRYIVEDFIGLGGTGLVFLVCDKILQTRRVLKIARPLVGKSAFVEEIVESEIGALLEMSHPNVMPIFDRGTIEFDERRIPYYVMAYVSGGLNARKYFATHRTRQNLLDAIVTAVEGIKHLHQRGYLHLDLKPSNFLVSPTGNVVVADLGSAKKINSHSDELLTVFFTDRYAHPTLKLEAQTKTDSNRVRGTIRRSGLIGQFDLFPLGKSIFELVDLFEKHSQHELDPYTRKYLTLLAARLLDGHNVHAELALGLPESVFKEVKYRQITEVETDLRKLLGTSELEREIPELARSAPSYIQVSTLARTPFTERLGNLMDEPLVRRLGAVSQLGLLNSLYPTATHTRLEHSLGAYTNTAQYIYYLYHDPINPFFRQMMTTEDLVSTLIAAFLHDLGQYPLAHDLEDAREVIFSHLRLTSVLLKSERVDVKPLTESLSKRLADDWHVRTARVDAILNADPGSLDKPLKDRLLHTLIDGPIDADKLDYLVRDSRECGVPYGRVIDFPRLLRTLTVVYHREGEGLYIGLGIHEKGRVAAECVAFARYAMFSQVYWHHTARAAKAMLHRAVWEWLEDHSQDNDSRKTEFHRFVLGLGRPRGDQKSLFEPTTNESPDVPIPGGHDWSQVHPGDLAVLQWLRERTSPAGIMLIEGLINRHIYKRLAVVSEVRNKKLWERLQYIHSHGFEASLELARNLQGKLRDAAEKARASGDELTSTSADEDAITIAIGALSAKATILVDVPGARSAEQEVLRYMPEAHHREQKEQFTQSPTMEDSPVWELVGGNVFSIAGKVRVFCHPSVICLETTLLTQEFVEAQMIEAAREVALTIKT